MVCYDNECCDQPTLFKRKPFRIIIIIAPQLINYILCKKKKMHENSSSPCNNRVY